MKEQKTTKILKKIIIKWKNDKNTRLFENINQIKYFEKNVERMRRIRTDIYRTIIIVETTIIISVYKNRLNHEMENER